VKALASVELYVLTTADIDRTQRLGHCDLSGKNQLQYLSWLKS